MSSIWERLRQREAVFALCVSSVVVMAAQSVVAPILPLFAAEFDVTTAVIALSVSLFGFARLVLNIPLGMIADRFGRRPVLIGGPIAIALSTLGAALSPNIGMFLLWRCVGGAGSAMYMTAAQVYLADISTPENRARNFATNQAALWIGVSIGPALGGFLAEGFGLRAPFYVVGTIAAVTGLYVYARIRETRPDDVSRVESSSALGTPRAWQLISSKAFIAVGAVCLALFTARAAGQQTLMPLHAQDLGMSAGDLGLVFTAIAITNLAMLAPSAYVADRFGPKWAIVPAGMVSTVGLVLVGLSTSAAAFTLGALVYGVGVSIAGPAPVAYVAQIAPPHLRGLSLGLYRTVGDFGFTFGPPAMGAVADASSIAVGLQATGAIFAVGAISFAVLAGTAARRPARSETLPPDPATTPL